MARQLHFQHLHNTNHFQVGFAGMTFFLCAIALFKCASHSRAWRQWRACYEPDTIDDHSVQHIQHGNNRQIMDVDEDEVSVWQKNILMGGKCQLPDFSGVIIYDTNGSVMAPSKPPRLLLPWK
ncbi:uncharacterized protein LOC133032240 [Cannabis sativa]|nr:uncharacterized protein LOC115695691 [Cannabis sativa]XP_060962101.1 uncharacterized protein LOC133032240 [Cannabis sativa]KAF4348376.1 hypothetical protein G4B88_015044 [Cannabis sativa]